MASLAAFWLGFTGFDSESPVDFAIVGSSNFTKPGLTENVELNLFSTDQAHIENLREWYKDVWKEGEEVREEILKVIEPHLKEYDPFTVYAKALYEFFAGREKTQDEWELNDSVLYWKLSQYQKDGYHQALEIAERWNGALVCDGVGLGKTFIGLMILERCLHEDFSVIPFCTLGSKSLMLTKLFVCRTFGGGSKVPSGGRGKSWDLLVSPCFDSLLL